MVQTPITKALKLGRPRSLPYSDDEPDPGLLSTIGSASLSGIARIGAFLDIPGAVVRNTLGGGNPIAPLAPWNWFDDDDRISGRDLLRKAGAIGAEDTTANWWGGLLGEVALDPLTYASFGASALTKGGKVVQAIGKLDDVAKVASKGARVAKLTTKVGDVIQAGGRATREAAEGAAKRMGVNLDEVGQETVGSLARLEIPFTGIGVNIGTAQTPGALELAKGLDVVGEFVKASPLGRVARGLFDPAVGGEFSKAGQMAQEAKYAKVKAAEETVRNSVAEYIQPIKEMRAEFDSVFGQGIRNIAHLTAKGVKKTPDELVDRVFNDMVSLTADLGGDVDSALSELSLPVAKMSADMRQRVVKLVENMQRANESIHTLNKWKGIKEGFVESVEASGDDLAFKYNPRYATDKGTGLVGAIKNLGTRTGSSMGREEVIQQIPEVIANKMLVDDGIREASERGGKDVDKYIIEKYGKYIGKGLKETTDEFGEVKLIPKWTKEEHAKLLAGWVKRHEQFPIFSNSKWNNYLRYQLEAHVVGATVDSIYELLQKNIGDAIPDPLNQVALADPAARESVRRMSVKELLAHPDVDLDANEAMSWLGSLVKKSGDELANMTVPEDVANAIISMRKTGQPAWMEQIGNVVDAATDLFKRNVTLPFPAFWSRNLMGGQFVNAVSGLFQKPEDFTAYGGRMKEAFSLWKTGDGEFVKELFVNDVVDYRALSEGVRSSSTTPEFGYVGNPAAVRKTFQEVSGEVAENPLFKSAGLNTAVDPLRKGYGTAMRTGEKASGMVEFLNRVPMYLYLTRDLGWTPAAAAAKVKELQIDYSSLTGFEKQVMKRLAPFYSYSRKIAPVIFNTLAERPGGALAQTIRVSREASGGDATTPEWVQSTLSIPNPFKTPEPGGASYITGFGLPFETLGGYFEGPRGGLREGLSQLNPLLKAPLEWASNQSFFQTGPGGAGRPLDDLDPTLGRTIANLKELAGGERERNPDYLPRPLEFAIANSPASRFATTARQLTDPRKTLLDQGINLLTGARVTDISPAAQDAVLRERAMEMMRGLGSRSFSKTYFPGETKESMTPMERGLAEKLEALQSLLADRAKARRAS